MGEADARRPLGDARFTTSAARSQRCRTCRDARLSDSLPARQALPFSQNQFVQQATRVPPKAFEAYVKGIQTDDKETRANYLKNALRFYADANGGRGLPAGGL